MTKPNTLDTLADAHAAAQNRVTLLLTAGAGGNPSPEYIDADDEAEALASRIANTPATTVEELMTKARAAARYLGNKTLDAYDMLALSESEGSLLGSLLTDTMALAK